jgi:hypothetical protein
LLEVLRDRAFLTEFIKLQAARGRGYGQLGPALIAEGARRVRLLGAEQMDLKVRTHLNGVAYKPTEAAVALYDEAGFDVEHDELEHLYQTDAGQEYRTAAVDVILSNFSAQLPADVVCVVSSKCRISKGEWYETELTEALDAHHKATDGAKVSSLLPRKGQKTNIFFFAPRRHAAEAEQMDCS